LIFASRTIQISSRITKGSKTKAKIKKMCKDGKPLTLTKQTLLQLNPSRREPSPATNHAVTPAQKLSNLSKKKKKEEERKKEG
jgi:hypothetical protein